MAQLQAILLASVSLKHPSDPREHSLHDRTQDDRTQDFTTNMHEGDWGGAGEREALSQRFRDSAHVLVNDGHARTRKLYSAKTPFGVTLPAAGTTLGQNRQPSRAPEVGQGRGSEERP